MPACCHCKCWAPPKPTTCWRAAWARLAAEPQAVHALIRLTGGLPLALSIAAARAAAHPSRSLAVLAGELRGARGHSPVLHSGEASADLRAAFSWSYRQLSKPAARVFRLLGTHPGPDVTAAAVTSLAGSTPRAAHRALTELTRAGLATEPAAGRFRCHDLLRSYAAALSEESDTGPARESARGRMLDHYLHTGYAGMLLIEAPDPPPLAPARPGVRPEDLGSQAQAMAWFRAEHEVLLAMVGEAVRHGFDRHAWLLPTAMVPYLNLSGRWPDWAATQRTALAAAQRLDRLDAQARAHRYLGLALTRLRRDQEAHLHLQRAFRLFCQLGDRTGQASTHLKLGELLDYQQRHREALDQARRALHLVLVLGHRYGQATAWNMMGREHIQLGAHDQGIDCHQRALALCTEADGYISGDSWQGIGLAHARLGRPADAIACYQQAVASYRQGGDRPGEGVSLARLGDIQHAAGDLAAAAGSWRQALRILAGLQHPDAAAVRATYRQFCR